MFTRLKIAGTWACWHVPLHSSRYSDSAHRFMLARGTLVRGTYRVCAPGKSLAALPSVGCLEQKGWAGAWLWSLFSCALQINSHSWRCLSDLWLWSLLLAPWHFQSSLRHFSLSLNPGHLPSQQTLALFLPTVMLVLSGWSHPGTVSP